MMDNQETLSEVTVANEEVAYNDKKLPASTVVQIEDAKKSGWYPGKFVTAAFSSANANKDGKAENDSSIDQASEKTSTFSRLSRMLSGKATNTADDDRDKDETEEEKKSENLVVVATRKIRNKLIARKLVGKIFVHRLSGVVVTKMACHVQEDDLPTDDGEEFDPFEEVSGNFKRAISATDTILNSLERRSRAWDGVEFIDNVTLTRGVTLGVSDPFVGFIGFSWTFEITCTVKSLLASRKRFELARDSIAQMYPPGSRSSSFSFSLTSSSKQLEQLRNQVKKEARQVDVTITANDDGSTEENGDFVK